MTKVRVPSAAGLFYPDDARVLRATIDEMLQATRLVDGSPPQAMIQPHAGYQFSGPVAATGYRRLAHSRPSVGHVVVLGPNHTVALQSIAVTGATAWETPLGQIPIADELRAAVLDCRSVGRADQPHLNEHAIEVQLPFLQQILQPGWDLLPMVVGDTSPQSVAAVIDACWGPDTLIIVSSDLSHYHSYAEARRIDDVTIEEIATRSVNAISPRRACGAAPIRGLLASASAADLRVEVLDARNSGDTTGNRQRVVGYASIVFVNGPIDT